jgi:hypothetical protein
MFQAFASRPHLLQRACLGSAGACGQDYRYQPLLAGYRDDGVVAVGSPRGWVNEDVDVLVDDRRGHGLLKHHVDVLGLEHLLKRVEGQPAQLGLDEVGPVLHDGLQLHMPVGALPPVPEPVRYIWMTNAEGAREGGPMPPPVRYPRKTRTNKHQKGNLKAKPGDEVEHVDALGGLPLGLARGAGQLHAQVGEHGLPRDSIPHLHEPRVEVDLARQGADGQERGVAHNQERRDGFLRHTEDDDQWSDADSTSSGDMELPNWARAHVKEPWVDVGGLLEDDDVAPGALGRGDLPSAAPATQKLKKECDTSWRTRFWAAVELL